MRAVVSAVPDALIPYVERGLEAVGRIITFKEPCRTWQPKAGSLIANGKEALKAASESSLPPGFTHCELSENDAVTVNDAWKYKTANSITMVKEAIDLRPSVGIKDSMGNLAAWAVLRADLSWGLLATREDVRRKGLGKAVMLAAFARQEEYVRGTYPNASELALLTSPYVHIKTGNEGSEGLFAALDFEPVAYVTWVLSSRCSIGTLQSLPTTSTSTKEDWWLEMLTLINTSYRADDAFFVDQERTDASTILDMARVGEFFTARDELTGVLGASVYLKTTMGRGVVEANDDGTATVTTTTTTTPFSADSRGRQEGGEGGEGGRVVRSIDGPSCAAPVNTCIALPLEGGSTVTISMLTILPSLKRRGLATRLLKEIEARARAQGAVALEAFVVSVKPWLFDFYEKHGFKLVGAEEWPPFLEWQLKKDCYFKQVRKIL